MLRKVGLNTLNSNITCPLCGGYFVDATTIMECLHSFCKSCIVKYLDTSFNCPVCQTEIHKTRPLLHVRPDPVLQDLVYKLVPCLYDDYQKEKQEFNKSVASSSETPPDMEVDPKSEAQDDGNKVANVPNVPDPIYVTLEQRQRDKNKNEQIKIFPIRYLRCSSTMPVRILKKFLRMKFFVKDSQEVELSRSDEVLFDYLTLKEVARIYGRYGKLAPLDLNFDVVPKDKVIAPMEMDVSAAKISGDIENMNNEHSMNWAEKNSVPSDINTFENTPDTDSQDSTSLNDAYSSL